jgi:Tfp pilus assembly protein PilN
MTPRLDFLAAPARPSAWSWLLLAAGIAGAAWAGWAYRDAQTRLSAAEAAQARQQPAQVRVVRTDPRDRARETADREVERRLSLPWNAFLVTLQSTRPEGIVLQSLEADAGKGSFRIEAEARRHTAMLDYLKDLQRQPALADVTLARHETLEAEGMEIIGFSLSGLWRQP